MEIKNKTGEQHYQKPSSLFPSASALAKQPEREFRTTYQQLLSIFESIDEPIYVADPQTYEVLYVNKAIKKTFGNIVGSKCYQALQNRDTPCPFCTNKHILGPNLGKTHIWEFQNQIDKRWYRCIDKAIQWPDGRIVRYEMAIDLTVRKFAEQALREAEEKYRYMVENSFDAIIMVQNNNIVYVNKAAATIFGYSFVELVGRSILTIVAPEDKELIKEKTAKRLKGQIQPSSYEFTGLKKDGSQLFIETSSNGPFIYEKTPTTLSIMRNITGRRQMKMALAESESKYKSLFEHSVDGIAISRNNKLLFVNQALLNMGGYKNKKEFLETPLLDYFSSGYRKIIANRIRKRNQGKPVSPQVETRIICKNGTEKYVGITTFVISIDGQTYSQSTIRDITKKKEAEEALEKLNKLLTEKNKKLKQLSLKDPLTGLYNHLYFEEIIEAELERTRRYAHPLSVTILDIDYFKSINDAYGHHFGDLILKQLAKQLTIALRRYDILIRYSGQEFVIISPGTNRENATTLVRRILDTVRLYHFGDKKQSVKLKLSGAVASYPEDKIIKGADLVDLATRILDRAKQSGGNRIYSIVDLNNKKQPKRKPHQNTVKFLREKMDKLTKQANQTLIESIFALAKTIELKDHYTGEHVEKTVQYATEIASTLGIPTDEVERIRQAAILHDLGKIGISDKILLKKSKLTKREFEEIKKHPQIAADILRPIHFLHDLIPYIFYHHERWDGKGYPSGLKGNDIPLGARIISLADVYQALISDRPYRKSFPKLEALKLIKKGSGTQFDPGIVKSFLHIINQEK